MKTTVQILAATSFAALMLCIGMRAIGLVAGPSDLCVLVPAAFLAMLFTDFISALVHWFCDTYFAEDTPLLGPALIFPFREHHRDPQAMVDRSALEVNTNNAIAVLPWLALGASVESPSLFGQGFLVFFGLAVYLTNSIHKWAHAPSPPPGVRALQRSGLVLSPEHHRRHHFDTSHSYAITTGWLNPVLDHLRLFEGTERLVAWLAGRGARLDRAGRG